MHECLRADQEGPVTMRDDGRHANLPVFNVTASLRAYSSTPNPCAPGHVVLVSTDGRYASASKFCWLFDSCCA